KKSMDGFFQRFLSVIDVRASHLGSPYQAVEKSFSTACSSCVMSNSILPGSSSAACAEGMTSW
ncbi:MAG: hypothetical protein ACPLXR_07445, partial [Halothiobacillaceae bacterium]